MEDNRHPTIVLFATALFGCVSIAAAFAKAWALAQGSFVGFAGQEWSEEASLAMIVVELLVGAALIYSGPRRAAQLAGLGLYLLFLAELARRSWQGEQECGCFGHVDVPTPFALVVCLAAVLSLAACIVVTGRRGETDATFEAPLGLAIFLRFIRVTALPIAIVALLIPIQDDIWHLGDDERSLETRKVEIVGGVRTSFWATDKYVDGIVSISNNTDATVDLVGCRRTCDSYNAEPFPVSIPPGGTYDLRMKLANTQSKVSVTIFTSSPTASRLTLRL